MSTPSTIWSPGDLERIGTAEELRIASLSADGTLTSETTIWVIRIDDDLYVRAVNGRAGRWYRGTQEQHEGRIQAGGVSREVVFAAAAPGTWDAVDAAYHAKYDSYGPAIVGSVLTQKSREATLRLLPR